MVYTASSLVANALSMADLENTSFPTATENRLWINNAFADIYQKAIDNGEKYWYEITTLQNGDTMPEDFYQLADIYDESGQIPRYSKNLRKTGKWYDIRNGSIILNPDYSYPNLTIEYFPKPVYLDPNETGDVELDFPNNIMYTLVSLKLAEYYKIKQNGDISGLEMLIEDMWDTYFDTMKSDDNQNTVITDVYHNNRRYW